MMCESEEIQPQGIKAPLGPGQEGELELAVREGNLIDVVNLLKDRKLFDKEKDKDFGFRLLVLAIRCRHEYVAKFLLYSKVIGHWDVGKFDDMPLHLACSLGYFDIAKMVLDTCPCIDRCDDQGKTAIYYCYNLEMAKLLLDKGARLDHRDHNGRTPLDELLRNLSLFKTHYKQIQLYLDHGSPPSSCSLRELIKRGLMDYPEVLRITPALGVDLHARDDDGYTAFLTAVQENEPDDVKLLIDCGSDMYARAGRKLRTALHIAASWGHVGIMKLLLDNGFKAETPDADGNTALHLACEVGNLEAAALLLIYGINPNAINKAGETCLHVAVKTRIVNMVKMLLYGTEKAQLNSNNSTLPRRHSVPVVKEDSETGLNINATDRKMRTPLHYAADRLSTTCFALLLDHDADTDILDNEGKSPVYIALENYSIDIIQLMINKGIDITKPYKDNCTPLHVVARCSPICKHEMTICDLLINEYKKNLKDIDITDAMNNTPLCIAMRHAPMYIIFKFITKGANLDRVYWLDPGSIIQSLSNPDDDDEESRTYLLMRYARLALRLVAAKLPFGAELLAEVNIIREEFQKERNDKEFEIVNTADIEFEEKCLKELESLKRFQVTENETMYDFLIEDDMRVVQRLSEPLTKGRDNNQYPILKDFPYYRGLLDAKIWAFCPHHRVNRYAALRAQQIE